MQPQLTSLQWRDTNCGHNPNVNTSLQVKEENKEKIGKVGLFVFV
jgi:hypothetical protein